MPIARTGGQKTVYQYLVSHASFIQVKMQRQQAVGCVVPLLSARQKQTKKKEPDGIHC